MRILGFDLETTGLDVNADRIIELGAVLWDTEERKPIVMKSSLLHDVGYPKLSDDIIRITGITQSEMEEFGENPYLVLNELSRFCEHFKVEYLLAHNGVGYDFPLLMAELKRHGVDNQYLKNMQKIDTQRDIPFGPKIGDSRKLQHLAPDHGFLNPFNHRALFDTLSMLKVVGEYDFHDIIEYSKIPWVLVRALVSYEQRDLAKARRYSWEKAGDRSVPKAWIKLIKETELEAEKKACNFEVVKLI